MLSVAQPWAWAIFHAGKDVENRVWAPERTPSFRVLVHATRREDFAATAFLANIGVEQPPPDQPLGAIIGMVTVAGFVDDSDSPWAMPGACHWLLADPLPAERPMFCRGQPGLWLPPAGWQESFPALA